MGHCGLHGCGLVYEILIFTAIPWQPAGLENEQQFVALPQNRTSALDFVILIPAKHPSDPKSPPPENGFYTEVAEAGRRAQREQVLPSSLP